MHLMTLDLTDRIVAVMEMAVEVQNHFSMRNLDESANSGDVHQSLNSSFPHDFGNTFPHTCVCVCVTRLTIQYLLKSRYYRVIIRQMS